MQDQLLPQMPGLIAANHENRALFGNDMVANLTCLLVVSCPCPCWEEVRARGPPHLGRTRWRGGVAHSWSEHS